MLPRVTAALAPSFSPSVVGLLLALLVMLGGTGCRKGKDRPAEKAPTGAAATPPSHARIPQLPQRAYLWQRDWTSAVTTAIAKAKAQPDLSGIVILAAEVEWKDGRPQPVKPKIEWAALTDFGKSVSLALRIAPHPGPFEAEGDLTRALADLARERVASAQAAGVPLHEFQLDFDCAQKKLAGYRHWVRAIREAVAPLPLIITALPSWLGESEFPLLAQEAHHYVLQVHSVSSPQGDGQTQICDPVQARRWVTQAAKLRLPYEIALPTYRSQVGYGTDDQLVGVRSDSVRPAWPAGTRVREYAPDADLLAFLVDDWQTKKPKFSTGLLWYRLPVATDDNNWKWPTFEAVLGGRVPRGAWTVQAAGQSGSSLELPASTDPLDLMLMNTGETDDPPACQVIVSWDGSSRPLAEALPGWSVRIEKEKQSAVFFRATSAGRRLPPGEACAIGWLRLQPGAPLHVQVVPEPGA